jgi:hypothetical protein
MACRLAQTNVLSAFTLCVLLVLTVVWNLLECLEHLIVPEHHDAPRYCTPFPIPPIPHS